MTAAAPLLRITCLRKQYQALRPLRMAGLALDPGERVALSGLDAGAAEVLVNLVTGASLPDAGEVVVLGQTTASIADGEEWLASLDRFGIVSPRAVLLEGATTVQNVAMPLSLEIDPLPPGLLARATALAREAGIDDEWLHRPVGDAPPGVRARVHAARAIAHDPALLLMEHPTAPLPARDRPSYADDVARLVAGHAIAALIVSEDQAFIRRVAERAYVLAPATGVLAPRRLSRRWW